ncbi:hypothetical protein DSECCO2_47750 [anaerobic digester metagenome]|jgi:hypothetical protein
MTPIDEHRRPIVPPGNLTHGHEHDPGSKSRYEDAGSCESPRNAGQRRAPGERTGRNRLRRRPGQPEHLPPEITPPRPRALRTPACCDVPIRDTHERTMDFGLQSTIQRCFEAPSRFNQVPEDRSRRKAAPTIETLFEAQQDLNCQPLPIHRGDYCAPNGGTPHPDDRITAPNPGAKRQT